MNKRALVVLSGGQDSTICLFWAKRNYEEVHAVTFDYEQRHRAEITAATLISLQAGVTSHEIIKLGPILTSASPLTDKNAPLETYTDFNSMDAIIGTRVEKTFVPMRNALFLTLAANRAVCKEAGAIVTGVCEADNANYPDCTQAFITAQEIAINMALGYAVYSEKRLRIATPLIAMSKAKSIELALTMPGCYTALGYSHTAYDGAYPPTSKDHASVLRAHGFEEAGVPDPLVVRAWLEELIDLPETENYLEWNELADIRHEFRGNQMGGGLRAFEEIIRDELNIITTRETLGI